ncbi:MAG: desulfoferrodoxin family protein [Lachnospiraceae bacterium]
MKYLLCSHCKQMVEAVHDTNVPIICCGEKMQELIPGTTDAAVEKHIPVYEVKGNVVNVKVGEVAHPMVPEHYIDFITLVTEQGMQRKSVKDQAQAEACFVICEGDVVKEVYAYCNIHGMWKK